MAELREKLIHFSFYSVESTTDTMAHKFKSAYNGTDERGTEYKMEETNIRDSSSFEAVAVKTIMTSIEIGGGMAESY